MKITILAIGKKHDPRLISAIEDYTTRIKRYSEISWKLLEAKITPSLSEGEIKSVESNILINALNSEDYVILLDERGKQPNNGMLATEFQMLMNQGRKSVVFIIGGAYGVNQDLTKRANFIWSLSELVLPHQLVRLVLTEQIYRTFTILSGEKYHHI